MEIVARAYNRQNSQAAKAGAVCLDGSPPLYYLRPGVAQNASKWVFHIQVRWWPAQLVFWVGECEQPTSHTPTGRRVVWELRRLPSALTNASGLLQSHVPAVPERQRQADLLLRACERKSWFVRLRSSSLFSFLVGLLTGQGTVWLISSI